MSFIFSLCRILNSTWKYWIKSKTDFMDTQQNCKANNTICKPCSYHLSKQATTTFSLSWDREHCVKSWHEGAKDVLLIQHELMKTVKEIYEIHEVHLEMKHMAIQQILSFIPFKDDWTSVELSRISTAQWEISCSSWLENKDFWSWHVIWHITDNFCPIIQQILWQCLP
jgi:hypothetical protein